jgi:O-antigen biosynthesis protein
VRVSFLIPLYNCLALTQAMLASLEATLPIGLDHEIILIDDGSTDGTRDWLRTLANRPRYRVLLNTHNLGYAATNNRAAASATGEYLVLLNNDLILTPRWLEPMLAAHSELKAPRIVGNVQRAVRTGEIDHTGIIINAKGKPVHDRLLHPFAPRTRSVPAITAACFLISSDLWQKLRGFDTAFVNGGEDVDLCFRAHEYGASIIVAQRSIIYHHVSASTGRKRYDEQNSRLLANRWRAKLTQLAHLTWCREFIARDLSAATAFAHPIEALATALHATGLTERAPIPALRAVADAFDLEEARWHRMLD